MKIQNSKNDGHNENEFLKDTILDVFQTVYADECKIYLFLFKLVLGYITIVTANALFKYF
jgi:hypothetical protein